MDVQVWTNAVKTTSLYTPTANTAGVTVGDSVIDILRATFTLPDGTIKTSDRGFRPINRYQLDFDRPNWPNEDAGEPLLWTFDASSKQVLLIPKPDAAHAIASALTVLEVLQPTPLSIGTATSVPFDSNALMTAYPRALIAYAVAICLQDNNDSDSLQKSRYFRSNDLERPGEYEREIKKILMKFDAPESIPARVLYKPQGGRLGSPGQLSKSTPLGWS